MRVAIVTFPGSNCDHDLYKCIQLIGGNPEFVWHREVELGDVDAVMLPGGFSYGDYPRAGAIATLSPVMEAVKAFAASGGPMVGICNGFQTLCEAGLLPGALLRNESLLFASQDVLLRVENDSTIFTGAYDVGQILRMPIAHAEGNYHADRETLDRLEGEGRVLFRYVDTSGDATADANPNGSARSIAGIVNDEGNVMG
jgi:phosphoribosylformylglycinamidine synthase